jgi:hypothetical protein
MGRARRLLAACAVQFVLGACAASGSAPEGPALLVAPDTQTREELNRAVSSSLNDAPVTLADDALTKGSTLIIERQPARDAAGRLLGGRESGKPDHFHLVASGPRCTLVHEESGRRIVLTTATCRAAS